MTFRSSAAREPMARSLSYILFPRFCLFLPLAVYSLGGGHVYTRCAYIDYVQADVQTYIYEYGSNNELTHYVLLIDVRNC